MGIKKITLSIWSNNPVLEKYLCEKKKVEELIFEKYQESRPADYLCLFVDLCEKQENLTSNIYNVYLEAKNRNIKIAIVLLPGIQDSSEKTTQIQKTLSEINSDETFHRTIICHDLYFLDSEKPITSFDKYINEAVEKKEINVSQKGNFVYYPISFINLLSLIKRSLYLSNTTGKEFFAQGIEIKDLSLAYLLKSCLMEVSNQDLDINNSLTIYQSKSNYTTDTYRTSASLNWEIVDSFKDDLLNYLKVKKNKISFDDQTQKEKGKIKAIKLSNNPFLKIFHKIKAINNDENRGDFKKNLLKKTTQFVEKSIVVVLLVYLFSSVVFVVTSYYSLKSLEKTIFYFKKGNIAMSTKNLNNLSILKQVSETNYGILAPIISVISPNLDLVNQNFLSFLNFSQTATTAINQTYTLAENIYNSTNNSQKVMDYTVLSLALKSNLQQVYESINQLEILLNDGELPKPLIQKIKQNLEYKQLKQSQEQIGETLKIIDFLPTFLGDKSSSNIFVLVQNDTEQRATGGAIDYVYQISFDKGKVVSQKTYLPQEIDKVDDFALTPPPLIEKITGDKAWHLSDMNYNPDFPQTATNIAWYLEKKLKIKPDIIISLNSSVLEKKLKNNLKDTLEEQAALALKHQTPIVELVDTISSSLETNNLMVWSSDSNLEKNILNQKYSGSIREYSCHPAMSSSRKCLAETSHINFSNFSLIPLNGYLQKTITHTVTPLVLSVEHQFNVDYKYQKSTPLINRNLTEIVQFYTPKSSVVTEIKINNENLPLSNLLAQEEETLTRYQFILSTALNTSQNLQIKYTVPLAERTLLPISYSFTDLKQSGQNEGESVLVIMTPDQSRASAITSEINSLPDRIIYKQTPTTSTFGINFVPKLP